MNFNDGTEEYEDDGKKLGHSGRVVLNPHTWEVTDIVVHSGYFFTTDKVNPVGAVQQTLEDRVILHENARIYIYPDYIDTELLPLVDDSNVASELPFPVLWYPPFGMMVYNPMISMNLYIVHEKTNIPVGSQALAVGSEVITSNGQCVGHMQEAFQESTTHLASHILISQSLLLLCCRRHDDAPPRRRSSDLDSQHPSAFEHLDTPAFISYLSWPDGRTKE